MSQKDVQLTYGEGFGALLEVLASARRPGSWYAGGTLETPMPAIDVTGVGRLSFPIPPAQAQKLIECAAERAPYGKGDQTLVDEKVRKVWQISPAKVKIEGKGWAGAFETLVQKVGEDLGCEDVAIHAEFYKMLVYERGSFFVSHRDSEKTDGMFGTLVVALSSAHKGGALVVRHAGREVVLDLCGEDSPSEITFAAFYADCEHEVRPLLSGHRICLIYNLVRKKGRKRLTPPDQRGAIAAAAPLLAQWAAADKEPGKIVHLLEHHYTQAALSMSALKGADAALAQVLVPAAAQAGCALHLGIVHIEESGWAEYIGEGYHARRYRGRHWDNEDDEDDDECDESGEDYEVGEVCDSSYYIDQWRTAGDAPVRFGQIPIQDGEVLPPGALDGEEPDESHFSEATGNEGASFERTYLRAALVLWPEDRFDRICASAGPDAALARLEQLVDAAKKASEAKRPDAEEAVRRLARNLPSHDSYDSEEEGQRAGRLLEALRRFGDADLLLTVARPAMLKSYDGSQNRELVAAVVMLGEKHAVALLAEVLRLRGPLFIGGTIELWTSLAKKHPKSRQLLTSTLDAVLEAMALYSPSKETASSRWMRRSAVLLGIGDSFAVKPVSPAKVSTFLAAVHASVCSARMPGVLRQILEKPDPFAPETVLLPALEKMAIPAADGPDDLWAHCARYYLQRSEQTPKPPRDWAQNVTLPGKSPLIRELEAFARDPRAQVHRFRVRKDLRQEIHSAIDHADLDMTHVTERGGSPQTLVCTKTRVSYERACKQYQNDLSDMRRLLALSMARSKNNDLLANRLRRATGAESS